MSTYTTSIKDIMQGAVGNKDEWTLAQMHSYSKQCFFDDEAILNVIKEDYRYHFVTSFAYHYFLHEIGLETFGLWRMRLHGKIYENADYINKIYDTIGRDVFTEYRIRHRKGKDNVIGNKLAQGDEQVDRDIHNVGESTANNKVDSISDQVTTNDLTNKTEYNSRQENRGTTTNKGTGSVTDERRGKDTTKDFGDTTNEHRGYDTTENRGYDEAQHRGNDIVSHGGYDIASQSGKEIDRLNEVNLHSDTPMGDLENMMHSPKAGAEGTGVNYATDQGTEYNYLSEANEHDASTVREFVDRNSRSDYNSNNRTDYNSDQKSVYNSDQKAIYNSDQKQVDNRTSETIYNSDNTQVRDTEDQTIDNTDQFRKGDDTERSTGTQEVEATGHEQGNAHEEHEDNTQDNTVRSKTEQTDHSLDRDYDEDIEDYSINYEMLLRLEPLMQKIWNIFDPLFMQIC